MEREQSTKKPEEEPKEPSVLEEKNFQEFIKDREIAPEDLKTIKKLSQYPKDFFIVELHNLFNLDRERSEDALGRGIKHLEELIEESEDEKEKFVFEKTKEFLNLFLEFTKKYDWATSWHLDRIFESRENQINYHKWLHLEWFSKQK